MPGAILVPVEDTWREDGTFKSVRGLRTYLLCRARLTPERQIMTYSAIRGRASQAWFVLTYRLLGYPNVRVYDGSRIEWGLLPGAPIEK